MPLLGSARVFRDILSLLQCNSLKAQWQHCLMAKARQSGDRKYLNIKGIDTWKVAFQLVKILGSRVVIGLCCNAGNSLSCRKT